MKAENSTREFCWKTTLQKTQLKFNESWNFKLITQQCEQKIQPENSTKRQLYRELNQIRWKLKFFIETTKTI